MIHKNKIALGAIMSFCLGSFFLIFSRDLTAIFFTSAMTTWIIGWSIND